MKTATKTTTKRLPDEHLITLDWALRYSYQYLTRHAPGSPAERATALADVYELNVWIRENWPEAKNIISPIPLKEGTES